MTCRALGNTGDTEMRRTGHCPLAARTRQLASDSPVIHPFPHLSNCLLIPCDVLPSVTLGTEPERWSLLSWAWRAIWRHSMNQASLIKRSKYSKGQWLQDRDGAGKKLLSQEMPTSNLSDKHRGRQEGKQNKSHTGTLKEKVRGSQVRAYTNPTAAPHPGHSLQHGPTACVSLLALCGFSSPVWACGWPCETEARHKETNKHVGPALFSQSMFTGEGHNAV